MSLLRSDSPHIVALSSFSQLQDVDIWTCTFSVLECAIWYKGQYTMTRTGLSGSVSAGVTLDSATFASGAASYTWGYDACRPLNRDTHPATSLTINGVTNSFSDEVPSCYTGVGTVRHTGTLDLGSDRTIWINMNFPWVSININDATIYMDRFILEVNPLPVSRSASSTTLATATSTNLSSGTSSTIIASSTSSGTNNSSGTGVSLLQTLSGFSSFSSVTPSGGITSANVGEDPSKVVQSNLPGIISGTVAGICLVIIIILLLWRSHRNRKRERMLAMAEPLHTEEFMGDTKEWVPYATPSAPVFAPGRGILYSGSKNRPPSSAPPAESQEVLIIETQCLPNLSSPEDQGPTPRTANHLSGTESGSSISNTPTSPGTVVGGLPAYDTYMYAPLVTFREGMPQNTIGEANQVADDWLHRWAGGHREFVPPHLERRLRAGGYTPGSNPADLTAEIWLIRFGVTRYELAGLQELYDRENSFQVL